MGILNKRTIVYRIDIGEDGRNRGEKTLLLELAKGKILVREPRIFRTKVIDVFTLTDIETDIFLSTDIKSDGLGGAVSGGLLFGGIGMVAGAILDKGRPVWLLEIKQGDTDTLYRLHDDNNKKKLEKYLNKQTKKRLGIKP